MPRLQSNAHNTMQLSSLDMLVALQGELAAEHLKQPFLLGPLLHGVIMESIDTEYAEFLHNQSFNPYSQYVTRGNQSLIWSLRALTNTAAQQVLEPIGQLQKFKLKKLGLTAHVQSQVKKTIALSELTNLIHGSKQDRFKLTFLTPTSFKSKGVYQMLPSLHLIYQNLIQHYSHVYDGEKEADPETVDYLASSTKILSYALSSKNYLVGAQKIPGFLGSMTIEVKGSQPLIGFAHMLFRFAEFSGVGIKTSLGMGGIKLA